MAHEELSLDEITVSYVCANLYVLRQRKGTPLEVVKEEKLDVGEDEIFKMSVFLFFLKFCFYTSYVGSRNSKIK